MRSLFEANKEIIIFIYGLVFFVLGLAIALRSRRYSRLELARSLKWLAAFGITHGVYEWGDIFIPIQATYLSLSAVFFLNSFYLVLLALSFTFLFEFGSSLMRPFGAARWLHILPIFLLALWAFITFVFFPSTGPDSATWQHTANALARYMLCLPGGILAAFGMRRQTRQRIAQLNVPFIYQNLQIAGIALFAYALLAGFIPPAVPFFPGNLINIEIFTQVIGASPIVFRSLMGLVMAITIIRALEVFEIEADRMIETMEQQQILATERERIARELHDGAIQTVYTAGLLVESAAKLVDPDSPAASRLEKAVVVMNDAVEDLRRSLGDLHPATMAEPLRTAILNVVQNSRYSSLVDILFENELAEAEALSPLRTNHMISIINEALSNVVRHAQARQVKIQASSSVSQVLITIQDDGIGLPRKLDLGYGLRNMHDRARLLGGSLEVSGALSKGTLVKLIIPKGISG